MSVSFQNPKFLENNNTPTCYQSNFNLNSDLLTFSFKSFITNEKIIQLDLNRFQNVREFYNYVITEFFPEIDSIFHSIKFLYDGLDISNPEDLIISVKDLVKKHGLSWQKGCIDICVLKTGSLSLEYAKRLLLCLQDLKFFQEKKFDFLAPTKSYTKEEIGLRLKQVQKAIDDDVYKPLFLQKDFKKIDIQDLKRKLELLSLEFYDPGSVTTEEESIELDRANDYITHLTYHLKRAKQFYAANNQVANHQKISVFIQENSLKVQPNCKNVRVGDLCKYVVRQRFPERHPIFTCVELIKDGENVLKGDDLILSVQEWRKKHRFSSSHSVDLTINFIGSLSHKEAETFLLYLQSHDFFKNEDKKRMVYVPNSWNQFFRNKVIKHLSFNKYYYEHELIDRLKAVHKSLYDNIYNKLFTENDFTNFDISDLQRKISLLESVSYQDRLNPHAITPNTSAGNYIAYIANQLKEAEIWYSSNRSKIYLDDPLKSKNPSIQPKVNTNSSETAKSKSKIEQTIPITQKDKYFNHFPSPTDFRLDKSKYNLSLYFKDLIGPTYTLTTYPNKIDFVTTEDLCRAVSGVRNPGESYAATHLKIIFCGKHVSTVRDRAKNFYDWLKEHKIREKKWAHLSLNGHITLDQAKNWILYLQKIRFFKNDVVENLDRDNCTENDVKLRLEEFYTGLYSIYDRVFSRKVFGESFDIDQVSRQIAILKSYSQQFLLDEKAAKDYFQYFIEILEQISEHYKLEHGVSMSCNDLCSQISIKLEPFIKEEEKKKFDFRKDEIVAINYVYKKTGREEKVELLKYKLYSSRYFECLFSGNYRESIDNECEVDSDTLSPLIISYLEKEEEDSHFFSPLTSEELFNLLENADAFEFSLLLFRCQYEICSRAKDPDNISSEFREDLKKIVENYPHFVYLNKLSKIL